MLPKEDAADEPGFLIRSSSMTGGARSESIQMAYAECSLNASVQIFNQYHARDIPRVAITLSTEGEASVFVTGKARLLTPHDWFQKMTIRYLFVYRGRTRTKANGVACRWSWKRRCCLAGKELRVEKKANVLLSEYSRC